MTRPAARRPWLGRLDDPAPAASLRLDVQGLRALAVLLVIANHLGERPGGGFVGVDVFFVISGFMITSLLLRERAGTGSISFARFYRRRAKRLLPASVTVLVVTVAVAHWFFTRTRYRETLTDALWALAFSGNWHSAAKETDYFRAVGPVSPLQHYWSLGVEEQFYVVWPVLLVVVLAGATRFRRSHRAHDWLLSALLAVVVLSLAWAALETAHRPTIAYFSTFSRTWELAVGAVVAVTAGWARGLPARVRPVLAWSGLAAIATSALVVDATSRFPAPWALLPVLGAALVLVAGEGGGWAGSWVLSNPLAVYVGNTSYSLYLWHFPVIVFAGVVVGDVTEPRALLGTAVVIAVLSGYSYHLVEDPVRRSSWLDGAGSRSISGAKAGTRRHAVGAVSGVLVIATGLTTLVVMLAPSDEPVVLSAGVTGPLAVVAGPVATPPVGGGPAVTALRAEVTEAVSATTWPDLAPDIDQVFADSFAAPNISRCGQMGPVPDGCTWGDPDASKTAVVVGDSVAMSWVAPLRTVLQQQGDWRLLSYAATGCTFTDERTTNSIPDIERDCPAKKDEAVEAILRLKPDLVVVSNAYGGRVSYATRKTLGPAQWLASTQRIVDRFRAQVGNVVLLAPPPAQRNIRDCYHRFSRPDTCLGKVTPLWFSIATAESALATQTGGTFVDTRPLFCDERGLCPSFVGDVVVKPDIVHVSPAYGQKIVPALTELLRESNVF